MEGCYLASDLQFHLLTECQHCKPLGLKPRRLVLRALNLEEKYVWTNLIEQRLDVIKHRTQLTIDRVAATAAAEEL